MRSKKIALFALGLFAFSATASADPDIFGREGLYDLSGNALVDELRPDLEYINGEVPSYAERNGRVGAASVEIRPNYIYVEDQDRSFNVPFRSNNDLQAAFNFGLREVYRALPDEFVFVYLFTSFQTNVGAFFYAPEANDTWGINAQGQFDANGASPREGFIFMNYWKSFEQLFGRGPAAKAQGRSVFNQEAGHRWGSFVVAGEGSNGAGTDIMRGRDDSHWSYFMHTAGSPMEGNSWRDNNNGSFTTQTGFQNWRFSDLDMYLMGMLPGENVEPWFMIADPEINGQQDLFRQPLSKASGPQIVQPKTIRGTRVDLSIGDVIARNGTRRPLFGEAPTTFKVVFVMLGSSSASLSESQRTEFDGFVEEYAAAFNEGTRGVGVLDYRLREPELPMIPIGGTCNDVDECNPAESNFCLPNPFTPSGICTAACQDESGCPVNWCCAPSTDSQNNVCMPMALCPVVNTCACDATADVCDDGCECDMVCEANSNNNSNANNNVDNTNNNGGSGTAVCACDVTYSCDMDADGVSACPCDPECGGCGCTQTANGSAAPTALVGAALLALVFLRRRRR